MGGHVVRASYSFAVGSGSRIRLRLVDPGLWRPSRLLCLGFRRSVHLRLRRLDLVVAITSSTTMSEERRGYRRQLFDLLETHVLPQVGGMVIPDAAR